MSAGVGVLKKKIAPPCSCVVATSRSPLPFWIVKLLSQSVFFFSSRRLHTRSTRDWSSDVCSSDLRADFHSGLGPVYDIGHALLDRHLHLESSKIRCFALRPPRELVLNEILPLCSLRSICARSRSALRHSRRRRTPRNPRPALDAAATVAVFAFLEARRGAPGRAGCARQSCLHRPQLCRPRRGARQRSPQRAAPIPQAFFFHHRSGTAHRAHALFATRGA